MITDNELYRIAIVLGSAAMILIVLYHFLEVNAREEKPVSEKSAVGAKKGVSSK